MDFEAIFGPDVGGPGLFKVLDTGDPSVSMSNAISYYTDQRENLVEAGQISVTVDTGAQTLEGELDTTQETESCEDIHLRVK